jgi:hypothetical protein
MGFVVDSDEADLLTKEDLHRVIGMNPVALRYDIMLRFWPRRCKSTAGSLLVSW